MWGRGGGWEGAREHGELRNEGRGEQPLTLDPQEVKMLVSLEAGEEKDEDVMQGPKDEGLVHDEEILETQKKLRETAWH